MIFVTLIPHGYCYQLLLVQLVDYGSLHLLVGTFPALLARIVYNHIINREPLEQIIGVQFIKHKLLDSYIQLQCRLKCSAQKLAMYRYSATNRMNSS
jgi:hypothetical protein